MTDFQQAGANEHNIFFRTPEGINNLVTLETGEVVGDDGLSPANNNKSDDDDFFASFDSSKPTKSVAGMGLSSSRPAPKLNQSSGLKVKKAAKPAVKKLPVNDSLDDGWDDF